jgi:hypothetical protein
MGHAQHCLQKHEILFQNHTHILHACIHSIIHVLLPYKHSLSGRVSINEEQLRHLVLTRFLQVPGASTRGIIHDALFVALLLPNKVQEILKL